VGPTEDGVQRRAQLVTEDGEEVVLESVLTLRLEARLPLGSQRRGQILRAGMMTD
jgi:hypothetical protein